MWGDHRDTPPLKIRGLFTRDVACLHSGFLTELSGNDLIDLETFPSKRQGYKNQYQSMGDRF